MGYMCVLFVRACSFVYVVLIICGIQGIEGYPVHIRYWAPSNL